MLGRLSQPLTISLVGSPVQQVRIATLVHRRYAIGLHARRLKDHTKFCNTVRGQRGTARSASADLIVPNKHFMAAVKPLLADNGLLWRILFDDHWQCQRKDIIQMSGPQFMRLIVFRVDTATEGSRTTTNSDMLASKSGVRPGMGAPRTRPAPDEAANSRGCGELVPRRHRLRAV